jgi:hypothetical protein
MPGMWSELERMFAQEGITIGQSVSQPSIRVVLLPSDHFAHPPPKIRMPLITLATQPVARMILRRPIENSRSMLGYRSIHQK